MICSVHHSFNFILFASDEKKNLSVSFALHSLFHMCIYESARVMSFTIFDNVVVVAIAAQMVLHVFLVLPCYVIFHFSAFVISFEEMKSLID